MARPHWSKIEDALLTEPCADCLDHGWHWVCFSGDSHDHRDSCLTPGQPPPTQFADAESMNLFPGGLDAQPC